MDPQDDILQQVFQEIDNDQHAFLMSVFTKKGQGRRPKIPDYDMKASNMLLLQLYAIMISTSSTWEQVTSWMQRLFPSLPGTKAQSCIKKAVRNVYKTQDRNSFYKQITDFNEIGPACSKIGLTHRVLKDPLDALPLSAFTRGVLLELETVFGPSFQGVVFQAWPNSFSEEFLKNELKMTKSRYQNMNKNKSRKEDGRLYLQEVVSSISGPDAARATCTSQSDKPVYTRKDPTNNKEVSSLKKTVEGLITERDDLLSKYTAHKEMYEEKCVKLTEFEEKMHVQDEECSKSKTMVENLEAQLSVTQARLSDVSSELHDIKSGASYKRFQRRKKYLNEREAKMDNALDIETSATSEVSKLKKENKVLQRELDKAKKMLSDMRQEKIDMAKEVVTLKQNCASLEAELLHLHSRQFVTRSDSCGKPFLEKIEKCSMELAGEIDIPTNKCSRTMQSVSKWMHNIIIPLEDLPSTSTINNFVDRAHVLSKIQVRESVKGSERWDLHGDGTSRDHHKIIGHQITLDSGETLSTGFRHVATEDSTTLLDNAITMMEELAGIYEEGEAEDVYKDMLHKMFAVMSDRSSVNKLFNQKLSDHRKTVLGDNEKDLHYLYCNAHFLLGLSNAADEVIKAEVKNIEKKIGSIGRDGNTQFKMFRTSGESGPARYVRTACDVLGPRGDAKSGCLTDWEGYCENIGIKSGVTSFRMNRFNNFFQGAAGLYHHRQDIITFLTDYKEKRNLKLESVLCDAKSEEIQALVKALGILYYKVTGPFWNMLHGDIEYVDQYKYIQNMLDCFEIWANDSSDLLNQEGSIFPEFNVKTDDVSSSLFRKNVATEVYTKRALENIMKKFIDVTKRQLCDFLIDGKYGKEPTAEIREKMRHCKLTNLVSEYEFGHLDFSQFRRRHASLYYHSGIQMVKRNKTISKWLSAKTEEEQSELLREARKKSVKLRAKHMEAERNVVRQIQAKLKETYRKKEETEARKIENKQSIISKVHAYGGPCKTPEDVDNLIPPDTTEKFKMDILKSEINYLKLILGITNKRLIFGKKKASALAEDLKYVLSLSDKSHVPIDNIMVLDDTSDSELTIQKSGEKRKKTSSKSSSKKTIIDQAPAKEDYKFTRQGTWVAVAYEENFFVGTVLNIESPEKALVQFLRKGVRSTFRYPLVDDIDTVTSEFVFANDFEVTSTNGRIWTVTDIDYLKNLYKQYAEMYFVDAE